MCSILPGAVASMSIVIAGEKRKSNDDWREECIQDAAKVTMRPRSFYKCRQCRGMKKQQKEEGERRKSTLLAVIGPEFKVSQKGAWQQKRCFYLILANFLLANFILV